MKHKLPLILSFCLCILFLSACSTTDDASIKNTLETLTSDSYEGRLYGSKGNQLAVEYISARLEDNGLVPFAEKNYEVSFQTELPSISGTSLTISGAEDITLIEGRDYFYSVMLPLELQGVIPEPIAGEGIPENQSIEIETDSGISLVLELSDKRVGNYTKISGREPLKDIPLGLTQEAMDTVIENAGNTITFRCDGKLDQQTLQNVIGVLPGNDTKRAIVLGAHFDHMGKLGDTIYQGAIDNASGVATLLAIIQELVGKTPDVDIVFAFWNAEEMGLQGSKAGVSLLENRYEEFCYINLDCIGMKDGGDTLITTNNHSTAMCQILEEELSDSGCSIIADLEGSMNSDHVNFESCGSVNLGQGDSIWDIIHTPSDIVDAVDYEEMERLAAAIATMLAQASAKVLDSAGQSEYKLDDSETITLPKGNYMDMSWGEQTDYIMEIEVQLAYDEYFILPAGHDNINICGREGRYFDTLKEAQDLYEGMDIAEAIGNYKLEQIHIYASPTPVDVDGDVEVGKVLKRRFSLEDISTITAYYENNGRCLKYSMYYNMDAEVAAQSYDKSEKLENRESAWLLFDMDSNTSNIYVSQENQGYFEVSQCPVYINDVGLYGYFVPDNDSEYTTETLLSLVEMVEQASPIITMPK